MTLLSSSVKAVLNKFGITGFESEEHFLEWLKWECPEDLEKRIIKELAKINY